MYINFVLYRNHYFRPLNTSMIKRKDPDQDPYLWLTDTDADPGGLNIRILRIRNTAQYIHADPDQQHCWQDRKRSDHNTIFNVQYRKSPLWPESQPDTVSAKKKFKQTKIKIPVPIFLYSSEGTTDDNN